MVLLVCRCACCPLKVRPHVGSLCNSAEAVTRKRTAESDYKLTHHLALKIEVVPPPSSPLRAQGALCKEAAGLALQTASGNCLRNSITI